MMNPSGARAMWLGQLFVAAVLAVLLYRAVTGLDSSRPAKTEATPPRRCPAAASQAGIRHEIVGSSIASDPRSVGAATGKPAPAGTPRRQAGSPYASEKYHSVLLRSEEAYARWELDPAELRWLLANGRTVLTEDLEFAPEPGGGLRLRRIVCGSFGALRGLKVGDVVRDINGQSFDSLFDIQDFLEDDAYAGALGWRVNLERDGKPYSLDFCAAAEAVVRDRHH